VDIRVAKLGDERDIAEVGVRTWRVAYRGQVPDSYLDGLSVEDRTEVWRSILSESSWPTKVQLVVEDNARVVGFAGVSRSRDEDSRPEIGEVTAIYLLPDYWDRGCGRALFDRAVETLKAAGFSEATLWVLDTNARARRFYEAAGWTPDGATKLDDRGAFTLHEVRYRGQLIRVGLDDSDGTRRERPLPPR
jgi:GNAT superfamily N-acetyltransferase